VGVELRWLNLQLYIFTNVLSLKDLSMLISRNKHLHDSSVLSESLPFHFDRCFDILDNTWFRRLIICNTLLHSSLIFFEPPSFNVLRYI